MSILIKGMEMPKHGEGVCLIVTNFESCGSPVAMLVDRESILPKDFYDAIEIPTPHGDLVDRDDLIDEINRVTFVKRYDYNVAYNIVTDAETIIEAEVSEE